MIGADSNDIGRTENAYSKSGDWNDMVGFDIETTIELGKIPPRSIQCITKLAAVVVGLFDH
jgi:hypothetical protein